MFEKIVIGILSAAAGAAVSWFITKKHYEKALDNLAESTVGEVQSMHDQLNELHRVFVEEQPIAVADSRQKTWDAIANSVKSNVGKTDEEVVADFRANIEKAHHKEQQDNNVSYAVETARYSAEAVNPDEYKGPSIYMITELEFDDGDPGYSKEEMQLWMVEEELYDEHDEPVDAAKGFIGITLEELMELAETHPDNEYFYYRNENTHGDYSVHIHRSGYSDYFQSISG
jgi:hypothetical protein